MSSRGCKPTERARLRDDPAGVEHELTGGHNPRDSHSTKGSPRMLRVPWADTHGYACSTLWVVWPHRVFTMPGPLCRNLTNTALTFAAVFTTL